MTFLTDHAQDSTIRKWYLVKLGFASPLYYTDCDIPIVTTSPAATWDNRPCAVSRIVNGPDGASCSVSIADSDTTLFPLLSANSGALDFTVDVWEAYFESENASAIPSELKQVFSGRIRGSRKVTAGGVDNVEFDCGPAVLTDAVQIPPRLLALLITYQKLQAFRGTFALVGNAATLTKS